MKDSKFYQWNLAPVVMACLIICLILGANSCGSTWDIKGNNLIINKTENDTILPKGTLFIESDTNLMNNGK